MKINIDEKKVAAAFKNNAPTTCRTTEMPKSRGINCASCSPSSKHWGADLDTDKMMLAVDLDPEMD